MKVARYAVLVVARSMSGMPYPFGQDAAQPLFLGEILAKCVNLGDAARPLDTVDEFVESLCRK
jgi:hypothetical protein